MSRNASGHAIRPGATSVALHFHDAGMCSVSQAIPIVGTVFHLRGQPCPQSLVTYATSPGQSFACVVPNDPARMPFCVVFLDCGDFCGDSVFSSVDQGCLKSFGRETRSSSVSTTLAKARKGEQHQRSWVGLILSPLRLPISPPGLVASTLHSPFDRFRSMPHEPHYSEGISIGEGTGTAKAPVWVKASATGFPKASARHRPAAGRAKSDTSERRRATGLNWASSA
jgi:hypothetical protein